MLPGESLSRHRRNDGRAEPLPTRAAVQPTIQASFLNPPLPATPPVEVIHENDGVSVGEVPETQPEVALAAHPELVPEAEVIHETPAPTPVPEPAAEYEPEEGFASYRVDPNPPSEYRQSAPVEEALEVTQPEPEPGPTEEEVLESLKDRADREPSADAFGNTHFLTPAPIGPEPVLSEPVLHEAVVLDELIPTLPLPQQDTFHGAIEPITGTPLPGHDTTMLNPMGEFVAVPQTPEILHTPEPLDQPEPTAPIHHEAAVLAPADLQNEHAEVFEEEEDEALTQSFAPGTGDLEEEVIDEDEYEVTALHAGYDDEMDDLEEETLEGTADLGTMLREMSIDQITRPAPEEGEEEDFEEAEETGTARFDQPDEDSEEYARTAESAGDFSNEFQEPTSTEPAGGDVASYNERRGGRRDVRRGGRDRDPARRTGGDSSGRPRNTGGSGDRDRGHSGGGRSRMSMQSTNLPAISELLKPGQEILVQIAKEPIAKKGARITSHIALPGRFLVFMPTVGHTGVSRKIESDGERRRLKEILLSEKGEASGGFIVRTAAAGASEEELRSDLRFLLNLWTDIKARSEASKSPALIYHDLNLVERVLRDQVTDTFSAIWVDTETEYERVLRFLQRFQPSLIRRVKLYTKETPLFEQFGITEEINKALRSKVWLKSGGSIVINQTEALVAIDINTGKFVGKTARLEDTIVKTNLDAIPEIVRQIRLRDLGGIIIIDFIDMDERKNRNKVMAALEDELKSDRAPSKVLQFNDFGLVAITRKRVKQSLERTLSTTCGICAGTGMVKSPVTVCNDIYIEMRKMHKHLDRGDVMLRVHPEVVKQLKSTTSRWLQEMEEMCGKTILVKSDPSLHPEQFDIH